jgi:lysozyme family protein
MSDFDKAIGPLLKREGGYSPSDNGRGSVNLGITLRSYQEFFPAATDADIRALTPEKAAAFYERAFWTRYRIGRIEDQELAEKVLDLAVNMGGGTACRMLQRVAGVKADGIIGPYTASVVNSMPPADVLGKLRAAAKEHYELLAAKNPALYGDDIKGWLARNEKV